MTANVRGAGVAIERSGLGLAAGPSQQVAPIDALQLPQISDGLPKRLCQLQKCGAVVAGQEAQQAVFASTRAARATGSSGSAIKHQIGAPVPCLLKPEVMSGECKGVAIAVATRWLLTY